MTRLIAEKLTYSYSRQSNPALEEVSVALTPGTLTALVGPNGAGKSTLLNLLQGHSKPDKGKITIDGHSLFNNRAQIALMPQRGRLNWNFPITVEGLVSLGRVNHSKSTCCELEAALQRVGISHLAKRRLDALSGALGGDEASTDISALGEGGDNPLDIALGGALDGAAQQGGAPAAGGAAGAGSGAAGADIAADEVEDEETDQAQVDDGGGG